MRQGIRRGEAPVRSGERSLHTRSGVAVRGILVLALAVGPFSLSTAVAQEEPEQPTILFHDCETEASPAPTPTPTPTPTPAPEEPEGPEGPEAPDPGEDGGPEEPEDPGEAEEPEGCMPREGQAIADKHTVRFTVETRTTRPIQRVRLFVRSGEEEVPHPNDGEPVEVWEYPSAGPERTSQETFTPELNTRTITPYNASYTLHVDVLTHGPSPETGRRHRPNVHVDNPPEMPAPPWVDAAAEGVSVEWRRAPEVDVTSYTLYRARTSSEEEKPTEDAFSAVSTDTCPEPEGGTCSFLDEPGEDGTYWYRILTTRRSVVTPEEGISSRMSRVSGPGVVGAAAGSANLEPRESSPRQRLSGSARQRLIPQRSRPVPSSGQQDSGYSRELPYDVNDDATFGRPRVVEDGGPESRRGVIAAALGTFFVAAGLALGRMPW